MAEEKAEKIILEREYVVPLRRKWQVTPEYRRASKAVKSLKEFIVKHMKIYDRDLGKVKLDKWLNEELWFKGIRKPLAKVRVKAIKYDSGKIFVSLAEIPEALKWKVEKEKKKKIESEKKEAEKKAEEKPEEKKTEETKKEEKKEEKTESEKKDEKEKEKSTAEAGLKEAEIKHREIKHEVAQPKQKKVTPRRMALQK